MKKSSIFRWFIMGNGLLESAVPVWSGYLLIDNIYIYIQYVYIYIIYIHTYAGWLRIYGGLQPRLYQFVNLNCGPKYNWTNFQIGIWLRSCRRWYPRMERGWCWAAIWDSKGVSTSCDLNVVNQESHSRIDYPGKRPQTAWANVLWCWWWW